MRPWILLKQETVSSSIISWDIFKSAPHPRQITTSIPPLSFLQAECPSCHPTNSVRALKAVIKAVHLTETFSHFHNTCPYHRNLFCCRTEIMSSTPSLSFSALYLKLYILLQCHNCKLYKMAKVVKVHFGI